MSLETPKLVLFDLDGTLVDSVPDLAFSINRTLNELSLPERSINNIRHWVGSGLEKLLHRSLTDTMDGEANEALFKKALDLFLDNYQRYPCEKSECYPGVQEGLRLLKDGEIEFGCVTNKREQFVRPILEKLGLINEMSIIVAGDTLPRKKPDPLPLQHALSCLDRTPNQSVMVGDSESDVKAARAAGLPIVCVSYGYNHGRDIKESKPDAVIDSIVELPALFH